MKLNLLKEGIISRIDKQKISVLSFPLSEDLVRFEKGSLLLVDVEVLLLFSQTKNRLARLSQSGTDCFFNRIYFFLLFFVCWSFNFAGPLKTF